MAKRARASRSAHRPGGQGPSRSRKTEDAPVSPVEPSEDAVSVGAAGATAAGAPGEVIEGDQPTEAIVANAIQPATLPESKRTRRARRAKTRPDDLAARAAAENAWVREDLRRIGIVSAILMVALAMSWVVFVALDVLNLY